MRAKSRRDEKNVRACVCVVVRCRNPFVLSLPSQVRRLSPFSRSLIPPKKKSTSIDRDVNKLSQQKIFFYTIKLRIYSLRIYIYIPPQLQSAAAAAAAAAVASVIRGSHTVSFT